MPLKALIFAGSYKDYLDFIREYHLKGTECKYIQNVPDIQGYHIDTNPDLLLIYLDHYLMYLDSFWLPRVGSNYELLRLAREFKGQTYQAGGAEAAARLIQLTYITRLGQLPEYLSHEHEAVREAALKRQEELMANDNNFTDSIRDIPAETKIVSGAPVKITRARSGSMGKDVEEDFVEKPEEGWLNMDVLNTPLIQRGPQSGFGRWTERIAVPLEQVAGTENASELPEMLTSEETVVQEAAEKKLRELRGKAKEEAPDSRFDIIDIPDE